MLSYIYLGSYEISFKTVDHTAYKKQMKRYNLTPNKEAWMLEKLNEHASFPIVRFDKEFNQVR